MALTKIFIAQMRAQTKAYGDFQTPIGLAQDICALIARSGFNPASALEPTCGTGTFIVALLNAFPHVSCVLGIEINQDYAAQARMRTTTHGHVEIRHADVLSVGLCKVLEDMPEPLLIIGNPPWVTASRLGALGSDNRPARVVPEHLRGIDAITGKGDFDISEWIIRECLRFMQGKDALLAMICKTSVARRALSFAWQNHMGVNSASLYCLDARSIFSSSVDACLLVIRSGNPGEQACAVFPSLYATHPTGRFGFRGGLLVADIERYEACRGFLGAGHSLWRSGIKHDCADVFELRRAGERWANRRGDVVLLENDVIYPLLKGGDLVAGRPPSRWMLVPQQRLAEQADSLRRKAPLAYDYLTRHAAILAKRKSSVYKGRSPFSLFGVGPYSFAPWKVAISALHKQLSFALVPPVEGKPVVLDDTCYFIPCLGEAEAREVHRLLASGLAGDCLSSLIFWDAKRPITAGILHALDLIALCRALNGDEQTIQSIVRRRWDLART